MHPSKIVFGSLLLFSFIVLGLLLFVPTTEAIAPVNWCDAENDSINHCYWTGPDNCSDREPGEKGCYSSTTGFVTYFNGGCGLCGQICDPITGICEPIVCGSQASDKDFACDPGYSCSGGNCIIASGPGRIQGRKVVQSVGSPPWVETTPATTGPSVTAVSSSAPSIVVNPTCPQPGVGTSPKCDPYAFSDTMTRGNTHTVYITKISGYEIRYTLCYGSTSCHNGTTYIPSDTGGGDLSGGCSGSQCYVTISDASILDASGAYADLYWHFIPLPSCNISGPSSLTIGDVGTYTTNSYVPPLNPYPVGSVTNSNDVEIDWNTTQSADPTTLRRIKYISCGNTSPTGSCPMTASWDPLASGAVVNQTYYLFCRAYNDGLHECRPFPPLSSPSADVDCVDTTQAPTAGTAADWIAVSIKPPGPWWQVKNADVTSGGDVTSLIPTVTCTGTCNSNFDLRGDRSTSGDGAGMPGIPVLRGMTADFSVNSGTVGTVSPTGWISSPSTDAVGQLQRFDFNYYINKIPSDVQSKYIPICNNTVSGGFFTSQSSNSAARGYFWFYYDGASTNPSCPTSGDLTITNNVNVQNGNKIVLIVKNASLNINAAVGGKRGSFIFMAVVQNDININKVVGHNPSLGNPNNGPDVEGLFVANGNITTGTNGGASPNDLALYVHGALISVDPSPSSGKKVIMQRVLSDNSKTPAEFFEYAPELLLQYPSIFYDRSLKWQEVAP
ncbi:hypothetical protein HY045_03100 [Candidatus Woesebacteria bacterium]|nr:hypothetical protein [Candidatus Woesebacteria bacterium]